MPDDSKQPDGLKVERASAGDWRANVPELSITVARFVLGTASGEDLVRVADLICAQGIVTPSLAILFGTKNPVWDEVGPLFERALEEVGVKLPDKAEATWQVIRYHVERIAGGSVQPRAGMRELMAEVGSRLSADKYVGDSHDLHHLIGNYYSYDDLEERPQEVSCEGKFGREAVRALDTHVVRLCRDWLSKHA